MESTDATNRDLEKAREMISSLLTKLLYHGTNLSSMTREDINYLRGRLDLLEYLLEEKGGMEIKAYINPQPQLCIVCKAGKTILYNHRDIWYCIDHLPAGITFPIGLHGDEFKAYKERKK